ncbi:EAL domain-containing protein [Actinotalea sp. Marseille-Q4924]|uniref:sensor domain-containing phosphodiesterase n=1 Tax=Actinotalea sp. Marseille-Q4924 TaxID=2866571 RepID=UPI001CE403B2|nr:EAL domain-containing protein [Actinotalea sp. Marseille-Q4924]
MIDAATAAPALVERRLRAVLGDPGLAGAVLDVHLQPIVALPTGEVVEMEALLRWDDPVLGPVGPDVVVPVAEATGLIRPLGRWVLERACAAAVRWPVPFGAVEPPRVAVNVSPLQLSDREFGDDVVAALRRTGLAPTRLVLEVTEQAGVADLACTQEVLSRLRGLGVRVALDDFGAGRTSLTLLRQLPLDTVKIDRTFVSGDEPGAAEGVLLRLLVDACHSLGLEVVAEGVEDARQATTVASLGIDRAQGWHFGYPEPAARAAEHLASSAVVDLPRRRRRAGETTDEFVVVTDPDRTVVFVSSGVFDVLGLRPQDVVGRDVAQLLHADDVGRLPDPATVRPVERLLRVARPDGDVRWLRVRTAAAVDASQGPRAVSTCRDVTEAEAVRRWARDVEQTFRRAFDEAPGGMSLTGLDGRIRSVNRALARLLLRSESELVGLHIDELTHPDDRAADGENLRAQREGRRGTVTVRKRFLRADGAPVLVDVVASVVHTDDGAPLVLVAHVTEV